MSLSSSITALAIVASSSSYGASAASSLRLLDLDRGRSSGGHDPSLYNIQRIIRTSLDDELTLIAAAAVNNGIVNSAEVSSYSSDASNNGPCLDCAPAMNKEAPPSAQPMTKTLKGNIRGGGGGVNNMKRSRTASSSSSAPNNNITSTEQVWLNLMDHAWSTADFFCSHNTDEDQEEGSSSSIELRHKLCPFLICSSSGIGQDVSLLLDDYVYLPIIEYPSDDDDDKNCVVLQTTPSRARTIISEKDQEALVVQPLLDVMKIHPNTIDMVTSPGWKVPFIHEDDYHSVSSSPHNASEASKHWERTLTVHLVAGLDLDSESKSISTLEDIINDIQDMSEVGWLKRQDDPTMFKPWQEEHLVQQGLVGVPALSDMFSLTSLLPHTNSPSKDYPVDNNITKNQPQEDSTNTKKKSKSNDRVAFWDTILSNGLESSHACTSLFSTLYVEPRLKDGAYYNVFDIILNPKDGAHSKDYASSASNVDCVTSFLVGLSVHPYVMSVESNVPKYYGWSVAINTVDNNSSIE